MGLEPDSAGVSMEEIDDILDGKVEDGATVSMLYSVYSLCLNISNEG